MDATAVKDYARRCGADIAGIGSMDRFEGAPAHCDPRCIMPEAKSIVVLGFRIYRGLLRGIEEGTLFCNYSSMGYAAINQVQMPMVLWNFCRVFEDNGYEALPMPNEFPWNSIHTGTGEPKKNWSRPVSPGRPAPDVFLHMRIAAYIAGLGEIGYSKLLLTPEFGPRVRLGAVLTELELEPDPLMEPGSLCDRCMACVKDCSGNAISPEETVRIRVGGKDIEWGVLDELKCSVAFQGGDPEASPGGEVKWADYQARPHPYNPFIASPPPRYDYGRAIEGARGCIRACMVHLEKQGKLKNTFRKPFRRRKPWRMPPEETPASG